MMISNKFLNFSYKKNRLRIPSLLDGNLREKLIKISGNDKNKLFQFLVKNLKYNLPKIFLENFPLLEKTYKKLNWPKNPEYIVTSYGQYYDEVFKIYCAHKSKNSKIYILQHGLNNIYADGDFYHGNLDKKISDKFLTWGNLKKDNSLPFIFPNHNKNIYKKRNKSKKILLIMYALNETLLKPTNGFITNTSVNQLLSNTAINFLEKYEQKKHLNSLKNFEVKLLNLSRSNSVKKTLNYRFPSLKFYEGKKLFPEVVNNYKLSFHFFLGTPFLEAMHYNKPCILILNRNIHVNFDNNFNQILKKLIKVNICFENVNDAIKFFHSNEQKIDHWWFSSEVQKIRKLYSHKYCANMHSINIFNKIFN